MFNATAMGTVCFINSQLPYVHLHLSLLDGVQNTVSSSSDLQQTQPQALHYALANAQQVQIHQIGEDGQVQVVSSLRLSSL